MEVRFIDPREAVLTESGHGLDAIGAMQYVNLRRAESETDADYRARLMEKLWGDWVAALTPVAATGEYLDAWLLNCYPDTSTDEPKPNHVRDAVRANM